MQNLLESIYDNVIYCTGYVQRMEKELEDEIEKILEPCKGNLNKEEEEMIRSMMYAIEMKAMKKGFKQGVRSSVSLLKEILKES